MEPKKIELTVSQLKTDLTNGLSWYKKDDLGYGSIQEKYGAKDNQIELIMSHPKLVGLQPEVVIFEITDDEQPSHDASSDSTPKLYQEERAESVPMGTNREDMETNIPTRKGEARDTDERPPVSDPAALGAFTSI